MTLYKTIFPDGFASEPTPSVVSIVSYTVEIFSLLSTNIINGNIVLSSIPDAASTVVMSWNGVTQYQGSTRDFTMSSNILTFTSNLLSHLDVGDIIEVTYQI
jgi:hypothetical protein